MDWVPISALTRRKASSIDIPDSAQMSKRSSASGKARLIDCLRFSIWFLSRISGSLRPTNVEATTSSMFVVSDCFITSRYRK